jgi:hypothetical protein
MKATLYIDRKEPFVQVWPKVLTDGSEVWDLHFRGGDVIHCLSEKKADSAFQIIAAALHEATGETPLVL